MTMSQATLKKGLLQDLVDRFSAEGFGTLRKERAAAIAELLKIGLPTHKSEEYKFTPVARFLDKKFSTDHKQPDQSNLPNIDEYLIPGLESNRVAIVNGRYQPALSKLNSAVTVEPLDVAVKENHEAVLPLGKYLDRKDPFALLGEAHWTEGLFVHVKKNTAATEPIVLHFVHDAQTNQVITQTRLLVVVEEGADVSLVEKHDTLGTNPVFNNSLEEIVVGENAAFTYFKVQDDHGDFHQVTNTTIHQSNNSRINTYAFTTDGKLVRNNLNILVDGEGCESHFYGLYLLNGDTHADNHTVVDHRKPNSFSNEMYKGIMDGHSRGVFNGKIYVRPHAQKTNAFQSNRNILLSDTATVNTKPQLEIWADDVKCSHGCTSGQLDEEAMFYLQTRGIHKDTAQAMLLYAFAAELIETIKDENLKVFIDRIVSDRLHRNF